MSWTVIATSLNLRSEPKVSTSNRIAVLPNGHTVEKISEADSGWWKVSTSLGAAKLEGFAASQHLAETAQAPVPVSATGIAPVHLAENKPEIVRNSATGRAFPLGEAGRPTRTGTTPESRTAQLREIIKWLDVEHNARYRAGNGVTFCNIYAYDYCYLSGVYLPRVWWTSKAIAELTAGRTVPVKYDDTVREMNANSLHNWLQDFGPDFGWTRVATQDELQTGANAGKIAMICAQRRDLNRSGHICAVVPEKAPDVALRKSGSVHLPLQSQAGAKNFCYSCGTQKWWANETTFRAFGFWVHD